ncbi:MAG TPA: hypothetical protein VJP76_02135, partial [Candidatus Tumulicola sp.]|nr:hypothetical protein [Candidatus Tumulicola sp.]
MSREFDFLTPAYFAAMAGLWQRAQAARGVATSAEDQTATLELLRERATKSDAWFAGSWSDGRLVAIVHGANARSNDGAGESVAGLMHLSMVAVDP